MYFQRETVGSETKLTTKDRAETVIVAVVVLALGILLIVT